MYVCLVGDREHGPEACPMHYDFPEAEALYVDPEIRRFARVAAQVEAARYRRWRRAEEVIEFSRRLGFYRLGVIKLGIIFCAGLRYEAAILTDVLETNGFEVVSAGCKAGAVPKEWIGLADSEKVHPGRPEMICNPLAQAELLNRSHTGLNILMGQCVGHDSLSLKHLKAPAVCLIAKGRVLAHNTVAALYESQGYLRSALYQDHQAKEKQD